MAWLPRSFLRSPKTRAPRPARFDVHWQDRRKRKGLRGWWVRLAALVAICALLMLAGRWVNGPEWVPGSKAPQVIDGDSLAIGERRIRLEGYDAPEIFGACESERRLARLARDELETWIAAGPFEWSGGKDPPRDKYGRELRSARRAGELLADRMIAKGLARPYTGEARVDWCSPAVAPQ